MSSSAGQSACSAGLAAQVRAVCLALTEVADPGRFFRPRYVGARGWIGVRLDRSADWAEAAEVCQDAYRALAHALLIAHRPVAARPAR